MTRTVLLSPTAPAVMPGTVLTLNRRAAKRLGVRPLRLKEFMQSLVLGAGHELASPALTQRLLTDVVRQQLKVTDAGLSARAVLSVVRELLREETNLEQLARAASGRVAQIARLAQGYRTALTDLGLLDPVQVASQAAALAQPQVLSLSGYPRLLPDEQRFLNAACAEGSIIHLPWTDHPSFQDNLEAAEYFEHLGWAVERDLTPPTGLSGAFLGQGKGSAPLQVANSEDHEVRTALGQIKGLLRRGISAEDIALVVPDDERWEGRVRAVAEEYGVTIRFSTSVTLAETRLGRWVLRALQAAEEDMSFDSIVRLLAHPLDVGLEGAEWQEVRTRRPASPAEWSEINLDISGLIWPVQATRGEWMTAFGALMQERGVAERAVHGQDLLALNFFRAELAVLGTPNRESISRAQFFEELRDLLALVTVPSQLGTTGVELLTPPSLIGAQVPYVFFLGLADGSLPAPLQDDPALDFLERKRLRTEGLHIETAASLSRRNAVAFWAALQAPGQATFSYARLGQSGGALPSAYLLALDLTEVNPPCYACSPEEARRAALRGDAPYVDAQLEEGRRRHQVEIQRLQDVSFSEFDGAGLPAVDPSERVFSATQLATLGRCGFRWWLEYGLRLTADRDNAAHLDLGRLRHAALRHSAQRAAAVKDQQVRDVMLQELETDWERAEQESNWLVTPEWERERLEHLSTLRQAVAHPGFLTESARPMSTEQDFEGEWMGFRVRGTLDRVDELNGRALIIDYKSGTTKPLGVQDRERKLNLDVQLALYAYAALPQIYPDHKLGGAMYVSLRTGEVIDRLKVNMSEYEALADRLRALLNRGDFTPRPDIELKACKFCSWQAVCRGGARLERKEFA